MGLIKKMVDKKINFYSFITDIKVVKFCIIFSVISWMGGLGIGYLVAQFDPAGPGSDPAGYSLFVNYISDLGSLNYTPIPKFLDDGLMLTGILLIPVAFYLKKILGSPSESKILRKLLSTLVLICNLIGACGIFLTGVISEDVGERLDAIFGTPLPDYPSHDLAADIAFYNFLMMGFFLGLLLIMYPDILRERIGIKHSKIIRLLLTIDMLIISPILFVIFWESYPDIYIFGFFSSFWEWMLVISYSAWQIPISLMLLKPLNRELASK